MEPHWWVGSQGSDDGGEKKGRGKGMKRKREQEKGTFRVPGRLLFKTWEEAEHYLRKGTRKDIDGENGVDAHVTNMFPLKSIFG